MAKERTEFFINSEVDLKDIIGSTQTQSSELNKELNKELQNIPRKWSITCTGNFAGFHFNQIRILTH